MGVRLPRQRLHAVRGHPARLLQGAAGDRPHRLAERVACQPAQVLVGAEPVLRLEGSPPTRGDGLTHGSMVRLRANQGALRIPRRHAGGGNGGSGLLSLTAAERWS
jgi:hypothetical protein